MRRWPLSLLTLALAFPAIAAAAQQQFNLTWAAGQVGGGWSAQAGALADLVKSKDPRFNIKVVPGAGIQNMTKLQQGEAEIAWGVPPLVAAAYDGRDPYKTRHPDIRLVMNGLGYVHIQFCAPADSPAQSIRDVFATKAPIRIGTPPGGSAEWVLRKIFDFYKTPYQESGSAGGGVVQLSYGELIKQHRERRLDFWVLNLAVPGAAIQEAAQGRKMKILPMDEDLLIYLQGHGLARGTIPKDSYTDAVNNDRDIPTIAMANVIVASAKTSPEAIHDLTKVLLGNVAAVRRVHPAFDDFDPRDAVRLGAIPLHPGALRAYREAKLLK